MYIGSNMQLKRGPDIWLPSRRNDHETCTPDGYAASRSALGTSHEDVCMYRYALSLLIIVLALVIYSACGINLLLENM